MRSACYHAFWQPYNNVNKSQKLYSTIQVQNRALNYSWSARSGGILSKVSYWEAPSRHEARPFLTNKPVPLSYTFYWQMVPLSHISSLEFCIPLNCCKCIVFKTWIDHKTRTYFRLFHNHKKHLLALPDLFTDRNDRFPYSFMYFNWWAPYPTWSLKEVPPGIPL